MNNIVSYKVDAGTWFLTFFKDFIGTPAILVALFSMLGAILLRKKIIDIILSFFKTVAGFLILGAGGTLLVSSLSGFQVLFVDLFGVSGSIPNNEGLVSALVEKVPQVAQLGSIIMVISMILNICLAYTSRFKYIYLSGHVLYYLSIMIAAVMVPIQDKIGLNLDNPGDYTIVLISGGLFISLYMTLSAASTKKYVSLITKSNDITVGHSGNISYALSGLIGELIYKIKKGKNIRSTESINFPKWLQFFRNTFVSMSISMLIVFLIVYIPEGIMYSTGIKTIPGVTNSSDIEVLNNLFGQNAKINWLVKCIIDAFSFAAGVEIILYGVRMAVGELVPSFKGFSEKVVKNSKPALDCPIVFPYAPNAVLIGFVSSLLAGILGIGITFGLSQINKNILPVVLPGLVAHFFLGATSGVFGNSKGGIWGAIIGSFVNGLIISLIPLVFAAANWNAGQVSLAWGDTDYLIGIIPGVITFIPNVNAIRSLLILVPATLFIILAIDGTLKRIRDNKNSNIEISENLEKDTK